MTLHLTAPIVRETHALDLLRDRCHVPLGDVMRVGVFLDGCIFSRHAKGVETHWIEHIEAHHPLVPGNCVTDRVIPDVPHVHLPAWVRIHLEAVELRPIVPNVPLKQPGFVPFLLPNQFRIRRK